LPLITIYSKPGCVQCDATYRKADNLGLRYTSIDISEDEEARKYAMSLGHQQAPVVVVGDTSWSGYVPANLEAILG
jgi:glutaredoxin-like protein NrdH